MAEPGWYDDPVGAFEKRYWDGGSWSDAVMSAQVRASSPSDANHPPPISTPPLASALADDRYLWAAVVVPVVVGALEMFAGFNPELSVTMVFMAAVANVALARADMRANPAVAHYSSPARLTIAALLIMPVYVYKRQRALQRSLMPFRAYLVAILAVMAVQFASGTNNAIDSAYLESEIESWAGSVYETNVTVDCPPDPPARAGHQFVCTMSDNVDTVGVRVEVLNSDGDVEWEVLG